MRKPMVFYAVSTACGCVFVLECFYNLFVGAAFAALFFIIFFAVLEKKFFILNLIFFLLACVSSLNYFSLKPGQNAYIRIQERKNYYITGSIEGRKVTLSGKLDGIEEGSKIYACGSFKNGDQFDRGIIGEYKVRKYKVLKKDFYYLSYKYKKMIHDKFQSAIGNDKSAVVMGICFGDVQYFTQEQKDEFQKLGVVHAVSVSGFHMAVLYAALENLVGFKVSSLVCLFYTFFTGMSAATVRSFIMMFVFKMSRVLFKEYDSLSSLGLAAVVLIMARPYYIVDIGFGLSFLATIGIILYYNKIACKLYMIPEKIASAISLDVSSQLFSLPYIAFTIQKFSYVSLLGNMILLPMYSVIVVLGNLSLPFIFTGGMFFYISKLIGIVIMACDGATSIILGIYSDIAYLSYMTGIAILISYISCLFYKRGLKKAKYIPIAFLIFLFFQNFNVFTKITLVSLKGGQSVIIESREKKIMLCNYDFFNSSWIMDIKDSKNISKVVTDPKDGLIYNIRKNESIKLNIEGKNFVSANFYENGTKFKLKFDIKDKRNQGRQHFEHGDALDKSKSYVIMFNRMVKVR